MTYGIIKLNIRQNRYPGLYAYLDEMSRKSKLLQNAALFRIRNNFTAHRGLYRSANGTCVNADLNGAANIGRKACPEFLCDRNAAEVLRNLTVVRFGTLYQVSG